MNREYHVTLTNGGCLTLAIPENWWVQQKPEWWEAGDRTGPLVRLHGRCYKDGGRVPAPPPGDCEPCTEEER